MGEAADSERPRSASHQHSREDLYSIPGTINRYVGSSFFKLLVDTSFIGWYSLVDSDAATTVCINLGLSFLGAQSQSDPSASRSLYLFDSSFLTLE